MKNPWRFFFIVESLLLVAVLWELLNKVPVLIFGTFAIVNIIYVFRKKNKNSFNQFQLIISFLIIIISLFSSLFFWFMIIFAIIFVGVKGAEDLGLEKVRKAITKKKKMIIVKTVEDKPISNYRSKGMWFGNERIGTDVYEWNDINIILLSGDTIIDLGNTLLPKDDNIILIRKGFGRTRILIPFGVGVMLEHSSLFGEVVFEETRYQLKNESLRLYSRDYDSNPRHLKIITNVLVGDIEVIRV